MRHRKRFYRIEIENVIGFAHTTDITTLQSYTPDGGIAELIAVNPITGNQRTRYIYGTTLPNPSASSSGDSLALDLLASDPAANDIARSDLLVGVIYPDAADSTDSVQNVYNRQGQVKQTRDQNGTTHQFGFDGFARRISDTVSLFGANVDQTVKRIDLAYEIRGMLELVTSYGNTTGTSVVNQVLRQFNAFAQLQYEYQQHDGPAVPFVSPAVQYDYEDGSANTIRPTAIIPPAGGSYATAFTYSGDDDALDRPTTVGGDAKAAYEYFGLGGIAAVNYLTSDTPIIASTLATGSSYPCFDQFGRLIEVPWTKVSDSSSLVDLQYGYNRASSRTFRKDVVAGGLTPQKSFDEIYTYDGIQRLVAAARGLLASAPSPLTGEGGGEGDSPRYNRPPSAKTGTSTRPAIGASSTNSTPKPVRFRH